MVRLSLRFVANGFLDPRTAQGIPFSSGKTNANWKRTTLGNMWVSVCGNSASSDNGGMISFKGSRLKFASNIKSGPPESMQACGKVNEAQRRKFKSCAPLHPFSLFGIASIR